MRYQVLALLMVYAVSLPVACASLTYQDVQSYVDSYNMQIEGASDLVKSLLAGLLGSETINANIAMKNGSLFSVGFETENALVSKTVPGGIADPSIVITANEGAIERIKGSDDQIGVFQKEMEAGQIKIEGTTWLTRLKLGAVLSSTPVLSFFSSVFFG
jgi:hypothetical protein